MELYKLNGVRWSDASAKKVVKALKRMFDNGNCRNDTFRPKCVVHRQCADFFDDQSTQVAFYSLLLSLFGTQTKQPLPFRQNIMTPLMSSLDECFVTFIEKSNGNFEEFLLDYEDPDDDTIQTQIDKEVLRHISKANFFR